MDIDPTLIIIILFVLAPLLERLLKAGKQQQPPPPGQQPQQRTPRPAQRRPLPDRTAREQRPGQQRTAPRSPSQESETSAADMLPDDLWAILTGERRPSAPIPPQEPPRPAPAEARRQPLPSPRPLPQRPLPPGRGPRADAETFPVQDHRTTPAPMRRPTSYDMRGELPPDEEENFRKVPPPEPFPVEGYVRKIPEHRGPEVVSLEELVIDDEKRHTSFHERVAGMAAAEKVHRERQHDLATLFQQKGKLRQAFIMSEVLGLPKALE